MKATLRIGEAATLIGVSTRTLRRWDKAGKLSCFRTPGNHRRIKFIEVQRIVTGKEQSTRGGKIAVYGRVSSHEQKQKGDLRRQLDILRSQCIQETGKEPLVFHDVGSGLNTKRKNVLMMCGAIEKGEICKVYVTYQDRLTLFGFQYLEQYFTSHGTLIHVLNATQDMSLEQELVQDLIAIVTSFSGRVHGIRSARARKKKTMQEQDI